MVSHDLLGTRDLARLFPIALICHLWLCSGVVDLMNEWNIQSRSHSCQACEKPFLDQQPYHTLLFDEKHDFRRLDICEPCWQAQYSQGASDRKGFVSYWHGVYETPPAAPPEPIQKENAETLLRKIIELNDPRYASVGFILAVSLERKRLLKIKEQFVRDGLRIFIYEHPKSGDFFTITDPNLHLSQLEQVQHDVAALLEHGFNPPPDLAAAPVGAKSESNEGAAGASAAAPELEGASAPPAENEAAVR